MAESKKREIRTLDLFCGGGGSSRGARMASTSRMINTSGHDQRIASVFDNMPYLQAWLRETDVVILIVYDGMKDGLFVTFRARALLASICRITLSRIRLAAGESSAKLGAVALASKRESRSEDTDALGYPVGYFDATTGSFLHVSVLARYSFNNKYISPLCFASSCSA